MERITECLAQNVKRLRKQKKLTQEELAKACGVSVVFLQNIEAGRRWVGPSTVELLAKGLNVTESELFLSEKQAKLLSRRGKANKSEHAELLELLNQVAEMAAVDERETYLHKSLCHVPDDIIKSLQTVCRHPDWSWDALRLVLRGFESLKHDKTDHRH